MKKTMMILGLLAVMAIVSCRDKKEIPPPPQVESTAAESQNEANETSISVGSDGIDIQSKDGKSETNVNVEGGEANLEIKK